MFYLFSFKKLLLAFEYGLIFSQTAKDLKIEITPEMVKRMEDIIEKEFDKKNPRRLAGWMVANIMAALEPKP